MKSNTLLLSAASLLLFQLSVNGQEVDIINLTFSPSNAGDVALNPNVSNILPWTNGSTTTGFFATMPSTDFSNGYAGLTVGHGLFGFKWGFEGAFDTTGSVAYDVHTLSFDYDALGHNGEASLALNVGSWSGTAPLPSTSTPGGTIFDVPVNGITSTGTVTYDFINNTLLVTRTGPGVTTTSYSTSFSGDLLLNPGTHAIDILVSNTVTANGAFDVNVNSAGGGNDGYYRIDNFRITGSAVPEPSSVVSAALGLLCLLRRSRPGRR